MFGNGILRRWGGRLAVFALLLQFFVSVGHFHPEDFAGSLGQTPAQHPIVSHDRSQPAAPGEPHSIADGCAICAAMQMVAIAVPPIPLALLVPRRPDGLLTIPAARSARRSAGFALFQSRAPPLV